MSRCFTCRHSATFIALTNLLGENLQAHNLKVEAKKSTLMCDTLRSNPRRSADNFGPLISPPMDKPKFPNKVRHPIEPRLHGLNCFVLPS